MQQWATLQHAMIKLVLVFEDQWLSPPPTHPSHRPCERTRSLFHGRPRLSAWAAGHEGVEQVRALNDVVHKEDEGHQRWSRSRSNAKSCTDPPEPTCFSCFASTHPSFKASPRLVAPRTR